MSANFYDSWPHKINHHHHVYPKTFLLFISNLCCVKKQLKSDAEITFKKSISFALIIA